ncbi:hypothetical protein MTO96_003089 [Rhipicephalus appendiculatus]
MMNEVLDGIAQVGCYIDDVVVAGSNTEACYNTVAKDLERLSHYNLSLKEAIHNFFCESVIYLGHKVSADGIYPTSAKIKAIQDAPEPMNLTELRAYLGLLNFYGKFLADLATVAAPLYELLKK